jgi:hypothetical protein
MNVAQLSHLTPLRRAGNQARSFRDARDRDQGAVSCWVIPHSTIEHVSRTVQELGETCNPTEDAFAQLTESESIRWNVREWLNETKRLSNLPTWKQ